MMALAPSPHPAGCKDFHQNPNGSWTPNVPIQIRGMTMGTGMAFTEGAVMGGINVAKWLDTHCR